jgi:hypothetical protein
MFFKLLGDNINASYLETIGHFIFLGSMGERPHPIHFIMPSNGMVTKVLYHLPS